jgi:hypothetical protein
VCAVWSRQVLMRLGGLGCCHMRRLPGKFSAAAGAGACHDCEARKFKTETGVNTACSDCPTGKLSTAVGASVASTCADCQAGKYSTNFGSASCESCRAGSYKETFGVGTCMPCTVIPGQYCPTASASPSGDACPTDHYCEGLQADKTKCPDCSVSMARSALRTDCACNVGYTGPNGGEWRGVDDVSGWKEQGSARQ